MSGRTFEIGDLRFLNANSFCDSVLTAMAANDANKIDVVAEMVALALSVNRRADTTRAFARTISWARTASASSQLLAIRSPASMVANVTRRAINPIVDVRKAGRATCARHPPRSGRLARTIVRMARLVRSQDAARCLRFASAFQIAFLRVFRNADDC